LCQAIRRSCQHIGSQSMTVVYIHPAVRTPVSDSPLTDPLAPARLGPLTLRNRVIKAATFEGVTPDALVTAELIEFHRGVAAGGVGMTTVAYCAASPEGRTDRHQIYIRP